MPYIRLSIARPRRGEEARLESIMRELTEEVSGQPGCQSAYILRPHDDSGEVARITIYDDEKVAEQHAQSARVLSLRSEMNLACEPGGHTERAFFSL